MVVVEGLSLPRQYKQGTWRQRVVPVVRVVLGVLGALLVLVVLVVLVVPMVLVQAFITLLAFDL